MTTLRELEDSVREDLREWSNDNPDNNDPDDDGSLSEIVDGNVPVYYSDLLQLAAEDNDLALTVPECGPAFDGSPTPVNIIAANVYEHLLEVAWDEWREIETERQENEEESES